MWERKGWDGMGEVRRARREECGEACEPLRSQDGVICAVKNDTAGGRSSELVVSAALQRKCSAFTCKMANVWQCHSKTGMETMALKRQGLHSIDNKLQEKGAGMENSDAKC